MNELRGPGHVLGFLWRRAAVIVLVAAVIAGLAFAYRSSQTDEYESVAKIAFVEDTRFDYVQAERDRLVGLVEEFVAQELDSGTVSSIEFFRPDRETFFDVVVRSTDPERSRDVANDVAARIVAADRQLRTESLATELAARSAQLTEIEDELADLDEEIAAQAEREAFAEANRFAGDLDDIERLTIELREAQDRLFLAVRYRNAAVESQIRTRDRITELEIDLDITEAETRVVRPALLPTEAAQPGPVTVAFIAGLSTLALCALGFALASTAADDESET